MNNVVFGCYHYEDITGLYSLIKPLEMKCQVNLPVPEEAVTSKQLIV